MKNTANKGATKMNKEQAQDELMLGMQDRIEAETNDKIKAQMIKQFRRVEKMFGYDKESWGV